MKLPIKWKMRGAARRRGDAGQAIVEFALVVPLMLAILTGIAMFSIAIYSKISLQSAANQGVQTLVMSQVLSSGNPCTAATTTIQTTTSLNSSLMTIAFY